MNTTAPGGGSFPSEHDVTREIRELSLTSKRKRNREDTNSSLRLDKYPDPPSSAPRSSTGILSQEDYAVQQHGKEENISGFPVFLVRTGSNSSGRSNSSGTMMEVGPLQQNMSTSSLSQFQSALTGNHGGPMHMQQSGASYPALDGSQQFFNSLSSNSFFPGGGQAQLSQSLSKTMSDGSFSKMLYTASSANVLPGQNSGLLGVNQNSNSFSGMSEFDFQRMNSGPFNMPFDMYSQPQGVPGNPAFGYNGFMGGGSSVPQFVSGGGVPAEFDRQLNQDRARLEKYQAPGVGGGGLHPQSVAHHPQIMHHPQSMMSLLNSSRLSPPLVPGMGGFLSSLSGGGNSPPPSFMLPMGGGGGVPAPTDYMQHMGLGVGPGGLGGGPPSASPPTVPPIIGMHPHGYSGSSPPSMYFSNSPPLAGSSVKPKPRSSRKAPYTTETSSPNYPPPPQSINSSQGEVSDAAAGKPSVVWSKEEERNLIQAVREMSVGNWEAVSRQLHERTPAQCQRHWENRLSPDIKRGQWTDQEDDALISLVDRETAKGFGILEIPFDDMKLVIPGRTLKQIRERWRSNLDPSIIRGEWTLYEDETIVRMHDVQGWGWAQIARELPGRTEHSVKTRHRSMERAQKRPWTDKEDGLILEFAMRTNDWNAIARDLKNRTPASVHLRFQELQNGNGPRS